MNEPPLKTAALSALNLLSAIGMTLPNHFRKISGPSPDHFSHRKYNEWSFRSGHSRRLSRNQPCNENRLCSDRYRLLWFQVSLSVLSRDCHFGCRFACPIVAALFEFERQILSATADDATGDHNMDMIGHDVVQKS